MSRALEIPTLDGAAKHYAAEFLLPDRQTPGGAWIGGPKYIAQDLFNFHFKDEFEYIVSGMKEWLGGKGLDAFEKLAKEHFGPRSDKEFAEQLETRLAIDPDGNHLEGKVGLVRVDNRIVGRRVKIMQTSTFGEVAVPKNVYWPIYAGETEERLAGRIRGEIGAGPGVDPLPEGTPGMPVGANVPNISAEMAIAFLDQVTARLDEGTTAATIRGRTGAQPADPDATESGVLLFTLTMTDPAFPAAVDDADGSASVTASAITDDSSADATNTLAYCRAGATGTGVDDHIDGEAGTSGADFNFNTLSIVSGSTVSMTSFVVGISQGSTAT